MSLSYFLITIPTYLCLYIQSGSVCDSGYGFIHFCEGHLGVAAAFGAITSIDKCNIVFSVEYHCEPSRNLVKMIQTGALTVNLPLPRKIREKLQVREAYEPYAAAAGYTTNKVASNMPPPMYEATTAQRQYNSNMPHTAAANVIGPNRSYNGGAAGSFQGHSLLNPETLASRSEGTTHAYSSQRTQLSGQYSNYSAEAAKAGVPPVVFNPAMHSSRLTSPLATERSFASSMRADLMPVIAPSNGPKVTLYFASHQDPADLTAGCSFILIEEATGNIMAKHAFVVCQYYSKSLQPEYEALTAGLTECIRRKLIGIVRIRTCSSLLHMQLSARGSEGSSLFSPTLRPADPLLEKARKMLTQLQVSPSAVELYSPYDLREVTELALQAYDQLRGSQAALPDFSNLSIGDSGLNTQQQQQQQHQQTNQKSPSVAYTNNKTFDFASFSNRALFANSNNGSGIQSS